MNDPLIIYKSGIDANAKQIVDDYWDNQNGIFVNYLKDLSTKYDLFSNSIEDIIKENSGFNKRLNNCESCNTNISIMVYSRSEYKTIDIENTRCKICSDSYDIQSIEKENFKINDFLVDAQSKLDKGINDKTWLRLNVFENEVLKEMIRVKTCSKLNNLEFSNNSKNYLARAAINTLSILNLLVMKYNINSDMFNIYFDDRLESLMEIENKLNVTTPVNDSLSLSFPDPEGGYSMDKPDYSGFFNLNVEVILKPNIRYKYVFTLQSDSSVNFRCFPEIKF